MTFLMASNGFRKWAMATAMAALAATLVLAAPVDARADCFRICQSAKRITCVVDGDTFWLNGEKVGISNIDAPRSPNRAARKNCVGGKKQPSGWRGCSMPATSRCSAPAAIATGAGSSLGGRHGCRRNPRGGRPGATL